jgi:hypothetical protein
MALFQTLAMSQGHGLIQDDSLLTKHFKRAELAIFRPPSQPNEPQRPTLDSFQQLSIVSVRVDPQITGLCEGLCGLCCVLHVVLWAAVCCVQISVGDLCCVSEGTQAARAS